ncbi:sarcosine oxidase subunit alpha family protein [Ancylobacter sp. Lp-2]|uniref:sarcosine oxidase subunit alpha family protein n=1 Tax=Ancylobacter sp. Lp-2 TaxID=2881339 RepID=UPI001E3E8074|nr:sarcosine oxidase subunit alpha family protein [Ancylobacter sp. Lp-2]MCB4770988.1 sarcosine oxidase subunit alpha family protein [Ancylobacter sp. Lp-2]
MSGSFRTPSGGRIDRAAPLAFRFDGTTYGGYAGDTLASALLANGVHLLGRSFKYHRPRGLLSAGSDEPNALVEVKRDAARVTPNLRATQVELYEGLDAASQNRWPSLARDAGAVNDLFAPFLPAGFYYKTFMWPAGAWKRFYEPKIRAMAGLGKAPTLPDPDRYTQNYAHCDVLVIGAGPAGIAAALAAAATSARVILVDEQAELGGSLLAAPDATVDTKPATEWLADALAELTAAGVVLMPRTTAFGYFPHNMIALAERVTDHLAAPGPDLPRERLWQVRAGEVVLATGALERPLVFPENDRPGILLADSARIYLTRYGVKPGERAVIFTAGDSGYRTALDLAAGGVAIAAIADLRAAPEGEWPARALAAGIDVRPSTVVTGTSGRLRVNGVHLAKVKNGKAGLNEPVACDTVLMSGGWTPSVHLFSQSRGKLAWDETLGAYLPGQSVERERSAGACRGRYGLAAALADGYHAGEEAAAAALKGAKSPTRSTVASRAFGVVATETGTDGFIGATPHGRNPAFAKAFVDWQNDVTAKDITLATREGFRSIEHVKRYTTTGMATDQGKTSNMNALGIVSEALGTSVPKIGLTTFRPPFTPTTFGIFAGIARGDLFDPVRVTPIHGWAEARGAVFEPVSLWKRALYFPNRGEDMHAAVARECKAVRTGVGIFDASTLGKIEVVGADAAEFMNRIYTNAWTKLAPGRLRYGVMLREDGFVMDDGVVGRLAPDRFHVTTTTGGAARVLAHMEDYLQTEWPDLDVWLTSTTEQWAVIAVQGPKSREVLASLVEGIDLSKGAMPNMSVAEGRIAGVPTRLFRLSFAGELGFEVNVPAAHGRAVWEAIFKAGEPFGITPYGTETMHVLRAEKGYIIVGQETDGTAGPDDVNLGWAVGKNKKDFVGKRSLNRAAFFMPDRKQLVGLLTRDPKVVLEEGAQLVADPGAAVPVPMLGHVTSAYMSATLGRSIALAMVKGGRSRIGRTLHVPMPKGAIAVGVVDPVFYDAEGARLDV